MPGYADWSSPVRVAGYPAITPEMQIINETATVLGPFEDIEVTIIPLAGVLAETKAIQISGTSSGAANSGDITLDVCVLDDVVGVSSQVLLVLWPSDAVGQVRAGAVEGVTSECYPADPVAQALQLRGQVFNSDVWLRIYYTNGSMETVNGPVFILAWTETEVG